MKKVTAIVLVLVATLLTAAGSASLGVTLEDL